MSEPQSRQHHKKSDLTSGHDCTKTWEEREQRNLALCPQPRERQWWKLGAKSFELGYPPPPQIRGKISPSHEKWPDPGQWNRHPIISPPNFSARLCRALFRIYLSREICLHHASQWGRRYQSIEYKLKPWLCCVNRAATFGNSLKRSLAF